MALSNTAVAKNNPDRRSDKVNELCHHGVKGQKWGVRRYREKDGTLTYTGKARIRAVQASKTMNDVNEIINTMSKKDKELLGIKDTYLTLEEGEHLVKRFLYKNGNTPISFFDLLRDGDDLNAVVGTRSGDEYRGKGYATKMVIKGMLWCEKNKDKWDSIIWGVKKNNTASINLAEKMNFEKRVNVNDNEWLVYRYKQDSKKKDD